MKDLFFELNRIRAQSVHQFEIEEKRTWRGGLQLVISRPLPISFHFFTHSRYDDFESWEKILKLDDFDPNMVNKYHSGTVPIGAWILLSDLSAAKKKLST